MNEERMAVINQALEGRLGFPEAARLLAAITDLEIGQTVSVEPPCRPPSWLEGAEDIGAMLAGREGMAIPALAHRLAGALRKGSMGRLTPCLAALDVIYLSSFWAGNANASLTFGGQSLQESGGRLCRRSVNIVFGGDPIGVWLFSLPLPITPAGPDSRFFGSLNGRDVPITTRPEQFDVTTPAGAFHGCLEVRYEFRPTSGDGIAAEGAAAQPATEGDQPEAERLAEGRSVWLAPGIGPVRAECRSPEGAPRIIELAAFGTSSGAVGDAAQAGNLFPRQPGFWWRFESRDGAPDHREVWRALAPDDDGDVWMSVAAFIVG